MRPFLPMEFAEDNSKMKVTCILSHIDGHSETTTMEGGLDNSGAKNDIQQKGSTHTYLQRYTLIGVLGLSTSDDDKDGNISKNKSANTGITEEEAQEQWKQVLSEVKNKTHLHSLYLQNKSVVDNNASIQAMFKEKQAQFKNTDKLQLP